MTMSHERLLADFAAGRKAALARVQVAIHQLRRVGGVVSVVEAELVPELVHHRRERIEPPVA